jgi:hypothetical protein
VEKSEITSEPSVAARLRQTAPIKTNVVTDVLYSKM